MCTQNYNKANTWLFKRLVNGGKFQRCQVDRFLSLLNNNFNKSLEVGCGKGFFSYVAAKTGRISEVAGCDVFNDFQAEELSRYANTVEYKSISNNVIPYKDNTFDLVFSMDVLEHVENDAAFVKEHLRVCKKGGTVIIGTPNYFRVTNLLMYLLGKLMYPRDMGSDTYGRCIHLREYKKSQLHELIAYSEQFIDKESVKVIPCWLGVMALDIGLSKLPRFLENYCQFWFIAFDKKL